MMSRATMQGAVGCSQARQGPAWRSCCTLAAAIPLLASACTDSDACTDYGIAVGVQEGPQPQTAVDARDLAVGSLSDEQGAPVLGADTEFREVRLTGQAAEWEVIVDGEVVGTARAIKQGGVWKYPTIEVCV